MSSGFGSSDQVTRRITELERKGRELQEQDTALDGRLTAAEGGITALDTRLDTLEARPKLAGMGSVSLAVSPATSTVKTDANVAASSIILPVASNANGWSLDAGITGITPAAGQFTVSHSASSLARSFNYIVVNP